MEDVNADNQGQEEVDRHGYGEEEEKWVACALLRRKSMVAEEHDPESIDPNQ